MMTNPTKVFVAAHIHHDNPVAYQNVYNSDITEISKRNGRNWTWRTYIAADDPIALREALSKLLETE